MLKTSLPTSYQRQWNYNKALVEAAAENDEGLMEKFFEEETLTEDELRTGIRKGLVTRSIFLFLCLCQVRVWVFAV